MEDFPKEEILADAGVVQRIQDQVENMGAWVRNHTELATETVKAKTFSPLELLENSAAAARRHKKGITKLGTLGVGTLGIGFVTGAVAFSHKR